MDDAYIESILSECSSTQFPNDFLEDYEAIECLAHTDAGMTLLVESKKADVYYVTKCYTDRTFLSHATEADILKKLEHPGLPRFVGEYENEHMLCVVREYVRGIPLDRYAAQHTLSELQTVSFASALCDILSYLHRQTPPIIHRDIKPQNLIVDKKGRLNLIDFGISRAYDKTAAEDTVCYGTKHFAAPEQYGFAQTDTRTDIFSLGVLIGWLLTGESELKSMFSKIKNRRLLRIVKQCTALAPDARFQSVEQVKRSLQNADGHRQKRIFRWACGLSACLVCLCAGFAIGRYTDVTPAFAFSSGVTFDEPLIEQAVRLALHKEANEPIQDEDLLSVTELYIYGDQVVENSQEFEELGQQMALSSDGAPNNGGLKSLNDLAGLKNLRTICIAFEDIADLSPLSGLVALEKIDLRHNPVEDISPLASLSALRSLCLFETRVFDLSSLAVCARLENVDVGKTWITSMAALNGIASMRILYMMDAPLQTLSGIESFTRLEEIHVSSVVDGDLRPLLPLSRLKNVYLGEALRQAADEQLEGAAFTVHDS